MSEGVKKCRRCGSVGDGMERSTSASVEVKQHPKSQRHFLWEGRWQEQGRSKAQEKNRHDKCTSESRVKAASKKWAVSCMMNTAIHFLH